LNPRRYLFSGGSPVSTSQAPAFALDCTFEVLGNTFAAVMVRREVYRALDGLDSVAFPTNYNDIDFSFRATNAGYRHVVVGSEIVEHVGRGSREADQDLPIDQRIIERAPRLGLLARIGFQQL
jgi:GT2 family glycosyltransferase